MPYAASHDAAASKSSAASVLLSRRDARAVAPPSPHSKLAGAPPSPHSKLAGAPPHKQQAGGLLQEDADDEPESRFVLEQAHSRSLAVDRLAGKPLLLPRRWLTLNALFIWAVSACLSAFLFTHAALASAGVGADRAGGLYRMRTSSFPDAGHQLLTSQHTHATPPGGTAAATALAYALLAALAGAVAWAHDARAGAALRTFAWVHSAVLLVRAAAFSLTLLPPPHLLCALDGRLGGCFARIVDLDTATAVLSALCLRRFFSLPPAARAAAAVAALGVPLAAVAARDAYSFEALLGVAAAAAGFVAFTHAKLLRQLDGIEGAAD